MAPRRPLPRGKASVHALAGALYQRLKLSWQKPRPEANEIRAATKISAAGRKIGTARKISLTRKIRLARKINAVRKIDMVANRFIDMACNQNKCIFYI